MESACGWTNAVGFADGRHRGHRRPDAELSSFVARGRDDATLAGAADRDRLAAKVRIVPLLDRRLESVHVDMDDLPLAFHVHRALPICDRSDVNLTMSVQEQK
jgi:hypothetical protein